MKKLLSDVFHKIQAWNLKAKLQAIASIALDAVLNVPFYRHSNIAPTRMKFKGLKYTQINANYMRTLHLGLAQIVHTYDMCVHCTCTYMLSLITWANTTCTYLRRPHDGN